jgi:hypothetical protein
LPERDGYITGVPCWVDTRQPDPDAAADFYGGLFGWEFEEAMSAGSPGRYPIARLRGGDVAAVSSQPSTDDPDATAATAADLGGTVVVAPVDAPHSRLTVLRDPQGATVSATAFVPEHKDVGREAACARPWQP